VDGRLKLLVMLCGLVLLLPGLGGLITSCCSCMWLVPVSEEGPRGMVIGLGFAVFFLVTLGGGGLVFYQGRQSVLDRPSQPLRLPPLWALAGAFPLLLALGLGVEQSSMGPLFFPIPLIAAALLPSVAALVWMMDREPGTLTRRRAAVAFVAGGTVSVGVALVLELLLPGLALLLVLDLAEPVLSGVEGLLEALAGLEVARALTSPGFLVALAALGVVAPAVEEMVKPLVTLPLLRHLKSPREALLLGAVAGAGFAAMENVIYATAGLPVWTATLVLRALGAAVHPVATGLVTVGWFRVLRREPGAGLRWLRGYGLAVGIHALWNGGSALLLALMGARFFGETPPEVDVLGVSVAGGLLALLAMEGVVAWIAARALSRRSMVPAGEQPVEEPLVLGDLSPDQSLAVWAVVCLLVLLPVGLAVLEATW
jgi:RsiW-degrading membrane proteinase PrsW (M82 family)